jgi:hypothetical protein
MQTLPDFYKELGLTELNKGCYRRGEWVGDGPIETSLNPHNNQPIGRTAMATVK